MDDDDFFDDDNYCPLEQELTEILGELADCCCSLSDEDLEALDARRQELEALIAAKDNFAAKDN